MTVSPWWVRSLGIRRATGGPEEASAGCPGGPVVAVVASARVGLLLMLGSLRTAPPGLDGPGQPRAVCGQRCLGWIVAVQPGSQVSRGSPGAPVPRSEHVVTGMRLLGDRPWLGRDAAQPAGLVVLERPDQLVPRVHHERPVRGDRLPDRLAAQEQDVEVLARPLLARVGPERERAARPENDQLPGPHRAPLGAHGAVPGQDV